MKSKSKVLRIIQEEGEMYGVITEKLGGGHAKVACMDNTTRMVVVGSKFKNERLSRNQMVLIGLREFQPDKADVIRAFNVLRQYDESEVAAAWLQMQSRLSENGILIEGTCDEIGRLSSWVTLDKNGPLSFTISLRLSGLDLPSKVAERLPKVLIHHNVAGEKIHDFLQAVDLAWQSNAGIGAFSAAQRWVSTCKQLVTAGWPSIGDRKRWRLGELTIDWSAVAPK
jgi:initiation factor 1A